MKIKDFIIDYFILYIVIAIIINLFIIILGYPTLNEIFNYVTPTFLVLLLFFDGVFFLLTPLKPARKFVAFIYFYSSFTLLNLMTIRTYPIMYDIFNKLTVELLLFPFNPLISIIYSTITSNWNLLIDLLSELGVIGLLLYYSLNILKKQ